MRGGGVSCGAMTASFGFVAIGRNEGERLVRCLTSLAATGAPVVYVDSGSTDRSRERAHELGALVVELDASKAFTAARARNFGLATLLATHPACPLVHFIDGDCELEPGWVASALEYLARNPGCAGVSGRRRERFPDKTPYNKLTDFEWDYGTGDAICCMGDALYRVSALRAVGGFRETLVAGEEPELGFRLRKAGHRLHRLAAPMTTHDIDMHRFSQWWRRESRTGHAYAEIVHLHGRDPERLFVRRVISVVAWGVGVPLAAVATTALWPPAIAGAALLYAQLAVRLYRQRRTTESPRDARLYVAGIVLGKTAQSIGALRYLLDRVILRKQPVLIEYKGEARPPAR